MLALRNFLRIKILMFVNMIHGKCPLVNYCCVPRLLEWKGFPVMQFVLSLLMFCLTLLRIISVYCFSWVFLMTSAYFEIVIPAIVLVDTELYVLQIKI